MRQEITEALSYALNKGIQIHPNALVVLEDADATNLMRVMREIIINKTRQHNSLITKDDVEAALGIKETTDVVATFDVLFDPSPNVASAEGIEGYGALFKSRYEKLRKIISQRPEGKKLKSVTSLVGIKKPNTEMYICGLVIEKNIEKDRATFKVDDLTGISNAISVYDEKIIEKVSLLLDDQMIMVEVIKSKKGNLVAKDVIMPGVIASPENRSKTDTYVAFISDLHIGSKFFMENEFVKFIDWLSSPDPKARKVRFSSYTDIALLIPVRSSTLNVARSFSIFFSITRPQIYISVFGFFIPTKLVTDFNFFPSGLWDIIFRNFSYLLLNNAPYPSIPSADATFGLGSNNTSNVATTSVVSFMPSAASTSSLVIRELCWRVLFMIISRITRIRFVASASSNTTNALGCIWMPLLRAYDSASVISCRMDNQSRGFN